MWEPFRDMHTTDGVLCGKHSPYRVEAATEPLVAGAPTKALAVQDEVARRTRRIWYCLVFCIKCM